MKTLIFSLLLLFSFSTAIGGNEAFTGKESGPKAKLHNQQKTMQRLVERHVFFPAGQGEGMKGSVDVTLQVYPDGEVRIIRIHSENQVLQKFIFDQLHSLKVDKSAFLIGQVFRYRFEFKREG
jgi:hypothetical protein